MGVYYRPPDQEEEVDEAFYRQLQAASQLQALVLMEDFNHPDMTWEDHTARHTQSMRFQQSTDDNFSDASGGGTNKERCSAGPCTNKQGGTGWECEGWG